MHSHVLDNYSHLDSPLHRLPVGVKVITALATVVALVALRPAWPLFGVVAAILAVAIVLSQIPLGFILRRLLLVEPFVLGVALLALLQPQGGRLFGILVTRTTLCLLAIILLANITPFSDLLIFLKRCRVPSLMITTLALMYRYLYLLQDESHRMKSARGSRTFITQRRRHIWRIQATVIAQLFARTITRAERIYTAMCARGWQ